MKILNEKELYIDSRGRIDVQKVVLSSIAVAGLVSVAVLAPNALQMLRMFKKKSYDRKSDAYINSVIERLIQKGHVEFKKVNGKNVVRLTPKGEREYAMFLTKRKPVTVKKWDKKWRVVMFDIKEQKRGVRNKVRAELEGIGFVKLQNSVWVFPYPCEEIIAMLKADAHIGKDVLYMVVEKIENDKWLRNEFNLR